MVQWTTPDTPGKSGEWSIAPYDHTEKGGKKMLLNELLLGQQGTHHTQHGTIVRPST